MSNRIKKNRKKKKLITNKEIEKIKDDVTNEAIRKAFILMLCIPTMVIHDKYAYITKKIDEKGRNREERFIDLCLDNYECILSDNVELRELVKILKDETGVDISKITQFYIYKIKLVKSQKGAVIMKLFDKIFYICIGLVIGIAISLIFILTL